MTPTLPEGPLVAWYGDDFTGTAAVMEVLTFAGLPSVMFLEPPGPERLAAFGPLRGIGIAGTARAESPDWMRAHLPAIFNSLRATGAVIRQYKICSTLDSAPGIGSIGTAMEVAQASIGAKLFPIYPAAPPMGRFQAFGTLFAQGPGGISRLDRHPVMAQHPVTPMDEAEVTRHLARQTAIPLRTLTLAELHAGQSAKILAASNARGTVGLALDTVSAEDQRAIGELIWNARSDEMLCVASQGLEYALVAYWQAAGLIPNAAAPASAGEAGPIIVVSGSVSSITAAQIDDAETRGFAVISLNAAKLASDDKLALKKAVADALQEVGTGRSVLLCTARGPDDPNVMQFRQAIAASDGDAQAANRKLGCALGDILAQVVTKAGLRRAVISGGDTSGHAGRRLGIYALSALAPTVPGAALSIAHSDDPQIDGLQLALKGGQMGTPDYFDWIRRGGGIRTI